ncbi:MAG: sulfatase-like hydrolase/transferase, partial [Myxococcota bacterium]
TPTFDRLAREGILFESAIAPAPITLPSHASILTGVYPSAHGVRDNGIFALAPDAVLVSEVLSRHGWRSAAFVGSYVLDASFGLDQGFEVFRGVPSFAGQWNAGHYPDRPASAVVDDAVAWLETLEPGERFFAWLHFFDPHVPHEAPEYWAKRVAHPYDAEIAFCDDQLRRLLRFLDERGLADGLLVAVTADHGEAFGEHGEESHGVFVYQATLRVPLVLSGTPLAHAAGTRVREPVSIASLAPTLLALAGLPAEELPDVRVAPLLGPQGGVRTAEPEDAIYLESYLPYHTFRWRALRGLVWGGYKLVDGQRPELYALGSDPTEQRDLADANADVVDDMRRRLAALLDTHAPLPWAAGHEPDAAARARLEALGYLAGSAGDDPFAADLPDPRDRIEALEAFSAAANAIQAYRRAKADGGTATAWQRAERREKARARLEGAEQALERARARDPGNPAIAAQLATLYGRLGKPEAALALLDEAVRARPRSAQFRQLRAQTYRSLGRAEDAVNEMQVVVSLDPKFQPAYQWFVGYYSEQGDFGRAVGWASRQLETLDEGSPAHAASAQRLERLSAQMRESGQRLVAPG